MADHAADTDFDPATFLADARQKFGTAVDGSRKARKARHKAITKAVDGRSLRATGRTQQLNFNSKDRQKCENARPRSAASAGLSRKSSAPSSSSLPR
jgi:hypothetical protein